MFAPNIFMEAEILKKKIFESLLIHYNKVLKFCLLSEQLLKLFKI